VATLNFLWVPHQCLAGSPQATDSSQMPLEAREQYPAFSRNNPIICVISSSVVKIVCCCPARRLLRRQTRETICRTSANSFHGSGNERRQKASHQATNMAPGKRFCFLCLLEVTRILPSRENYLTENSGLLAKINPMCDTHLT
jgi:hypothetical protein